MKLTNYKPTAARKILVYGAPKTGKTDLVGQLASIKKLWWFDLEDGIKTLLSSPRMKPAWFNNIELFKLPDTQTFPVAIETLLRIIKGGEASICHAHGVVSCLRCKLLGESANTKIDVAKFTSDDILVIDSVSQLSASAMNYIQRELIAKDNYDKKPDWDDYAKQGRILDRIFSILQQAPFHIVCISHESLVEMEDGRKKLVPIAGTSQFSKTFAKYFDDVVYTEVVNKKHKAASGTTYSGSILLGSRTGKELEKFPEPSLLELFK
jgi:AAA domain